MLECQIGGYKIILGKIEDREIVVAHGRLVRSADVGKLLSHLEERRNATRQITRHGACEGERHGCVTDIVDGADSGETLDSIGRFADCLAESAGFDIQCTQRRRAKDGHARRCGKSGSHGAKLGLGHLSASGAPVQICEIDSRAQSFVGKAEILVLGDRHEQSLFGDLVVAGVRRHASHVVARLGVQTAFTMLVPFVTTDRERLLSGVVVADTLRDESDG